MALFHLQSQQWLVESFSHSHLSGLFFHFQVPCDYIGPNQIIQDDLLILLS